MKKKVKHLLLQLTLLLPVMVIAQQKDSSLVSGFKYLIDSRGDTVGVAYYLIRNKDTINYITSDDEKKGYWEERLLGYKYSGFYLNGRKNGKWKSEIRESVYVDGWLKESISYGIDMDNNNRIYTASTLKLNEKGDVFVRTNFKSNGVISSKVYFKVPDRNILFDGFSERTWFEYFIKEEVGITE